MNTWATDDGIYLGHEVMENAWVSNKSRLLEIWKKNGRINRYTGPGNVNTFGPIGIGKSRKLLVTNLLRLTSWSTLVIDPKAELAVLTAKHRAENGSEVIALDPFGVIDRRYPGLAEELPYLKSRGLNPMAMLDPTSDDFIDDAKAIAEALIKIEGRETHWAKSAQALVTGLIMALRTTLERDDPNNSIPEVRRLLGLPPEELAAYIEGVIRDTESEPAIAAKLNRFKEINPDNRELLSILSTAVTQTDWIDSKPIQRALSGGTFDFGKMKQRPITVYLILPPRYLESHSTWLRLLITSVLTPLMRSTAKGVPVLLMLDEFAQLGRLEVIERNMALMRGYGIKLWAILQDLAQLKDCYPNRWQSFIANAGITQCFAPNDVMTREYLSKMSGKQRICIDTHSTTKSSTLTWDAELINSSTTKGKTHVLENVYPDDALAQMSEGQSVLFEATKPPRRTLLPDPSELSGLYPPLLSLPYPTQHLSVSEILRQADEFAAQYDVSEEVAS